ncbi:MAG: HAMP domain-containing protein [Candidatus Altiarchaeales archaeon]|nr:HAMP domain-containing protein [Candidatus Altiarchaeales archaeon]
MNIKKTIVVKVLSLMILMSIIAGALILLILMSEQTRVMEDSLIEENLLLAQVAARSIEVGYLAHQWPFETLNQIGESEDILFWWIVKPDGIIYIADSAEMWGKKIDESPFDTDETVVKDVFYKKTAEEIKLIIHPLNIKEESGRQWMFYMGVSLKSIATARNEMIITSIGFFMIVIMGASLLSFYLAKSLTKPLRHLTDGVKAISGGNLDHIIKVKGEDEIGQLAIAFNEMTKDLKEYRANKLEEYNRELEGKIEERTEELQARVDELERFHKLTVGRELKMIELKKRIKELEEKG